MTNRITKILILLFLTFPLFSQNFISDFEVIWSNEVSPTEDTIITSNYSSNVFAIDIPDLTFIEDGQDVTILEQKIIPRNFLKLEKEYPWLAKINTHVDRDIRIDAKAEKVEEGYQYVLKIDPIRIRNGEVFLVSAFTIELTLKQNSSIQKVYKSQSILAEGNVYELQVKDYGVHQITRDFLTRNELSNVIANYTSIKIYGSQGGILSENVSGERIDDYEEIPLIYKGMEDGTFDEGDAILFYAEGIQKINVGQDLVRERANHFGNKVSYYLKLGEGKAKTIIVKSEDLTPGPNRDVVTLWEQLEYEKVNVLHTFAGFSGGGNTWYGDAIVPESKNEFQLMHAIPENSACNIEVNLFARSTTPNSVTVNALGMSGKATLGVTSLGSDIVGHTKKISLSGNAIGSPLITVNYAGSGNSYCYIDNILVNHKRKANTLPPNRLFASLESLDTSVSYRIDPSFEYIDVSNFPNISYLKKNNDIIQISQSNKPLVYIFDKSSVFPEPTFAKKIPNQNLHGLPSTQMLIISSPELLEEAQRLATHRSSFSNITTTVVNVDEIYNEFGRGIPSAIAVRDFIKMLYDKYDELEYVLLFGDATFDFRNILNHPEYKFSVPSFQVYNSVDYLSSYATDDFYALLTDDEGNDASGVLSGYMELSVGRLPANSPTSAKTFVDKVIHYDTSIESKGIWKLNNIFISDDEDYSRHMKDSDKIADAFVKNQPNANAIKIISDAFPQESTAGGFRFPDATKKLLNQIYKGANIVNYFGHGSPYRWAQEKLFTTNDVDGLSNYHRLPLFVTATCTYAPYDNPYVLSAGEKLLHNSNGGAIALYSTVRPVYSSHNKALADAVFHQVATLNPSNLHFGKILKDAKNSDSKPGFVRNSRKFTLLGDPSQRLSIPEKIIQLETINDVPVKDFDDTIQALTKMKLSGKIYDINGNFNSNFNGVAEISIFDKKNTAKNLGQDKASSVFTFTTQEVVIYNGKASVVNGQFEVELIIPKDINYTIGAGKVSMYAYDTQTLDEAMGHYSHLLLGGLSDEVTDDKGPEVQLFLDSRKFTDGQTTSDSPLLIADLKDDIGISISGYGIGHDIIAYLDNDASTQIVLNDYYEGELNDYTKGSILYPLSDISPGVHTLTLRAWDVANNFSEATIRFLVKENLELAILDGNAYPNYFTDKVTLEFNHNFVGEHVASEFHIFSVDGKLVHSETKEFSSTPTVISYEWIPDANISSNPYYGVLTLRSKGVRKSNITSDSYTVKLLYIR